MDKKSFVTGTIFGALAATATQCFTRKECNVKVVHFPGARKVENAIDRINSDIRSSESRLAETNDKFEKVYLEDQIDDYKTALDVLCRHHCLEV